MCEKGMLLDRVSVKGVTRDKRLTLRVWTESAKGPYGSWRKVWIRAKVANGATWPQQLKIRIREFRLGIINFELSQFLTNTELCKLKIDREFPGSRVKGNGQPLDKRGFEVLMVSDRHVLYDQGSKGAIWKESYLIKAVRR